MRGQAKKRCDRSLIITRVWRQLNASTSASRCPLHVIPQEYCLNQSTTCQSKKLWNGYLKLGLIWCNNIVTRLLTIRGLGGWGCREEGVLPCPPESPQFLTVAIGTMVVPIRILIHTTVVPIRTLICTTAIISALSSYPWWWLMCNWCLFNWFHFILWYLLDFATNMCQYFYFSSCISLCWRTSNDRYYFTWKFCIFFL